MNDRYISMKTAYLNPYGQGAMEIIRDYGNIRNIEEATTQINEVIHNTYNQRPKNVNTIKDLCFEKIGQYYQHQVRKKSDSYNYLFTTDIAEVDTIATHVLLQACAVCYGRDSYMADVVTRIITTTITSRLEKIDDEDLINNTLSDYINIHHTRLSQLLPLLGSKYLKLNNLLTSDGSVILTYDDFMSQYSEYLRDRRAERIYELLVMNVKKDLLVALVEKQTRQYLQNIEARLKEVEVAEVIMSVGRDLQTVETRQRQEALEKQYGRGSSKYTSYDDDKPTSYMPEAFPPCVKKALKGLSTGGRNYAVSLFLTPFLSYARLYPGVYAGHIKNARVVDVDPTLTITREEVIPLIYKAAGNCRPPLFNDQPEEKSNITKKLGFGDGYITHENSGRTMWYKPSNCKSIQMQQPGLCSPCVDCKKIGNPLSYYNRKRKMLTREGERIAASGNTG